MASEQKKRERAAAAPADVSGPRIVMLLSVLALTLLGLVMI